MRRFEFFYDFVHKTAAEHAGKQNETYDIVAIMSGNYERGKRIK